MRHVAGPNRVVLVSLLAVGAAAAAVSPVRGGTTNWEPIGPAPLFGFFPGGVTGRASAIAVNPTNGDQVWLGTAAGGVWYSADAGWNWHPVSDDQRALAIGDIELAGCTATGCATVYAGTGENAIRRDTYHGAGLLRGDVVAIGPPPVVSWTLIQGGPSSVGGPPADFVGGSITDIARDPGTSGAGTVLYVTLSSGVTASASEATVTHPEPASGYGIYKTEDNGLTWEKLSVPGAEGSKPTDLAMDPADAQTLYAGFLGRGIFKTTDGGDTWCPLNPGIPLGTCAPATGLPDPSTETFDHVEIALFEGNSQLLYATFGHCPSELLDSCEPSVYRGFSGGAQWTLQRAPDPDPVYEECLSAYTRYTHGLTVHPTVGSFLWVGGIRLCQSADSGQTFQYADFNPQPGSSPWGPFLHFDHHEIVYDPTDSARLYSTSDGGFAWSVFGGGAWYTSNRDLQITGFHSIASSPDTVRVIGGAQDNGCSIYKGLEAWRAMDHACGDGGSTVIDIDTPQKMYAVSNLNFLGATYRGIFHRSEDGGQSWTAELLGNAPGPGDPKAFYPPIYQDVHEVGHPIYYGTNRLWVSADDGHTWSDKTGVLSSVAQPEIVSGVDVITAIATAPSNPNQGYVGYNSGALFAGLIFPGGWTDVSAALPDAPITGIAVEPTDPATVYVTFSGFGHDHVWKTTDFGGTWGPAVAGLPTDVPVNTIVQQQSAPYTLWLGLDSNATGSTVFRSSTGGASWTAYSTDLPNVPVYALSLDESRDLVYAGTHGRGAWALGELPVYPYETWLLEHLKDLPLFAQGLPAGRACTVDVLRGDGTVCATGDTDAQGGRIHTDAKGVLVTSRDGFYTERPLAWACFDGTCVGGADPSACDAANPIRAVRVTCGGASRDGAVSGPQVRTAPASSWLGLDLSSAGGGGAAPAYFDLIASVQDSTGGTRSLCSVDVSAGAGEDGATVLGNAMLAIGDSSTCAANGVTAELETAGAGGEEDVFPRDALLRLRAPGLAGTQLITAVHAAPGDADRACFRLHGLGLPVTGQLQRMRLGFQTGAAGAMGGRIEVEELSDLGGCRFAIDTAAGQAPDDIAGALAAAFQAPGIPTDPDCPSGENPRDVTVDNDSILTALASSLEVCVDDPGVGFRLASEELGNVHPVAVPAAPPTVECAGPSGAGLTLDGAMSSDPDSTPGTQDDIARYEWFEDFGQADETFLGSGATRDVVLPLGPHAITLRVTDVAGLSDARTIVTEVVDTTPPSLSVEFDPVLLWPPNHRLVDVGAVVAADDLCGSAAVELTSLTSSEPDDAPGPDDGETANDVQDAAVGSADTSFRLRAERDRSGGGRGYRVSYTAVDGSGNATQQGAEARVPLERDGTAEPLVLTLEQTDAGTVLRWSAVPGALHYNAIRSSLGGLAETAAEIDLGPVLCIEPMSPDESTVGDEDSENPAPHEVFLYFVEYDDGASSGYGTETAPKPREPGPGGC